MLLFQRLKLTSVLHTQPVGNEVSCLVLSKYKTNRRKSIQQLMEILGLVYATSVIIITMCQQGGDSGLGHVNLASMYATRHHKGVGWGGRETLQIVWK